MPFVEDQHIVERTLNAMSCHSRKPTPLISRLREEYPNSSIDARISGFLCISLGGSWAYEPRNATQSEETDNPTDWDEFEIVDTKEDIINLIKKFKPRLCALLRIEKEEFPDLKVCCPLRYSLSLCHI